MNRSLHVLVTGASGFVGRTLCPLLAERYRVTALVRSNVPSAIQCPNIGWVLYSGLSPNSVSPMPAEPVDVVVHLAAAVHVMDGTATTQATHHQINYLATVQLARQAAAAGVKRFIYLSSIKVNGESTAGQAITASSPVAPNDSYAKSKWMAEEALRELSQSTGMEVVIIRPPLVYGEGVKANFARLANLIVKGVPLPLASVSNSRSLVSVGNLSDLIACCIEHEHAAGETLLVADGKPVSTVQLCHAIARAAGRRAYLFPVPIGALCLVATMLGKRAEMLRLTQSLELDFDKTCQLLDWRPPESMQDALGKFIQ